MYQFFSSIVVLLNYPKSGYKNTNNSAIIVIFANIICENRLHLGIKIDQIIVYILSPLMGDGYKAGGIKTHPLVPKDIVVRGFIIDSETGALEEIN